MKNKDIKTSKYNDYTDRDKNYLLMIERCINMANESDRAINSRLKFLKISAELIHESILNNFRYITNYDKDNLNASLIVLSNMLNEAYKTIYDYAVDHLDNCNDKLNKSSKLINIDDCNSIDKIKFNPRKYYTIFLSKDTGMFYVYNCGNDMSDILLNGNRENYYRFFIRCDLIVDKSWSLDKISKLTHTEIYKKLNIHNPSNYSMIIYQENIPKEVMHYIIKYFYNSGVLPIALLPISPFIYNSYDWKELLDISSKYIIENSKGVVYDYSLIDKMNAGKDILIRTPEESFENIINFIDESCTSPKIDNISITLYRVSLKTPILNSIEKAVKLGKKVLVYIEANATGEALKNGAILHRLEKLLDLPDNKLVLRYGGHNKIHAKLFLATGKECAYAHIGTGNYSEKAGEQYIDCHYLSARPVVIKYVMGLFNSMIVESRYRKYRNFDHYQTLFSLIEAEKKKGKAGRIRIKCNGLTDKTIIEALECAAKEGVDITLILRNTLPNTNAIELYENVKIISMVGEYLHHERIFIFGDEESRRVFIGSVDLMTRNLIRRVETFVEIYDDKIKDRLEISFDKCVPDYMI